MIGLHPAGAGEFFLLLQQSCLQTALADHKLLSFITLFSHTKLQLKVKIFFFHTSVEMSQQILDALSFSSPCPTAVAEATVYGKSGCNHSEHAELEAPRNLRASTKCGELGSTHNFQMGKSSSMCS